MSDNTTIVYSGAHPEPFLAWIARHAGPWFALVWAPVLLIGPLVDAFAGGDALRGIALVVLGAAFAVTVVLPYGSPAARPRVRRERVRNELVFFVFLALGAAYLVLWQANREFVFPLLAIAAAMAVRRRAALGMVWALAFSGASAIGFNERSLDAAMLAGFATFFAGAATALVQYLVDLVAELTRSQQALARAAVAEERLRFSRDLHDLLGHTLSVIVVKAEAVRRLLASDPDAAAGHAAEIESIGRTALSDVRETATGYRSVSLVEEIEGARSALAAAGVELETSVPVRALGAEADSLLGWIVREATTNVLRHAHASRCRIAVTRQDGAARIEIADDGDGGGGTEGGGLRGLRERVERAGGEFTAGGTASGFRLEATVPEQERAREAWT